MYLYKTFEGEYVAKTEYGEWAARNAGFTWDRENRVWWTRDEAKAAVLSAAVGLTYESKSLLKPTQPPVDPWPTILEGRYAVLDPIDDELKFYRVDKPSSGKWKGMLFLKVYASDYTYPIKKIDLKNDILGRIAVDPIGAMARYGQEIGSCGVCGRTLTDELSRTLGIGPVCRKGMNLDTPLKAGKILGVLDLDYTPRGASGTDEEE